MILADDYKGIGVTDVRDVERNLDGAARFGNVDSGLNVRQSIFFDFEGSDAVRVTRIDAFNLIVDKR